MARLDVLRDFAALQMLIFRAVGLANPTEQVWLILSRCNGKCGAEGSAMGESQRAQFALVEYQDLTPASAPAWCRGRCSVAALQFKNTQDAGL